MMGHAIHRAVKDLSPTPILHGFSEAEELTVVQGRIFDVTWQAKSADILSRERVAYRLYTPRPVGFSPPSTLSAAVPKEKTESPFIALPQNVISHYAGWLNTWNGSAKPPNPLFDILIIDDLGLGIRDVKLLDSKAFKKEIRAIKSKYARKSHLVGNLENLINSEHSIESGRDKASYVRKVDELIR